MKKIIAIVLVLVSLQTSIVLAQKSSEYLPDKPGKWTYSSNIKRSGAEVVAFNKNLSVLAEWFHQNIPILKNPTGFDLDAVAYSIWDDNYKLKNSSYGLRAEMNFGFQLFLSDGGKWTIEPPHYEFNINDTESGYGGILYEGKDGTLLKELFQVFPLVTEIAPGVCYYDCDARSCGSLVIFNPNRPSFWIPVSVREVVDAKLKYYKQNDKMLYDFIKPLVDKLSEDELNAPAHYGSEDGILKVNGKGDDLQIMRFNPDYWDTSLPPSAIQFMTFNYRIISSEDLDESYTNNGHPNYSQKLLKEIDWKKLAGMIATK